VIGTDYLIPLFHGLNSITNCYDSSPWPDARASPGLLWGFQTSDDRFIRENGMCLRGKQALSNILNILGECDLGGVSQSGITFHMFGHKISERPKKVVVHLNLAVAIWTGLNSNGWNLQFFGYQSSQLGRYYFQHHGVGASVLRGISVFEELLCLLPLSTLDSITAQSMHRLGS